MVVRDIQKLLSILYMGFLLASCGTSQTPSTNKEFTEMSVQLTAFNLSEDMGGVGTINDELVLLVLDENTDVLSANEMVMDTLNTQQELHISATDLSHKELTFILLEIDTEKHLDFFQTTVTNHFSLFKTAGETQNLKKVSQLLSDDDVLGINTIKGENLLKLSPIIFRGMQLFDRYHYQIRLKVAEN